MSMDRSETGDKLLHDGNTETEEGQISESISRLREEVNRIESTTGPSKRTHCMRTEIERLESQMASREIGTEEHTDQTLQDTP